MKVLSQVPETPEVLAEAINPNLMINGDFTVNQRGILTDTPAPIINGTKMVDFCVAGINGGSCNYNYSTVNGVNKIRCEAVTDITTYYGFKLMLDSRKLLPFTEYTFSCSVTSTDTKFDIRTSDLGIPDVTLASIVPDGLENRVVVTFTTGADPTTFKALYVFCYAGAAKLAGSFLELSAVKLELGQIATPFIADEYSVNLAKCKYYFERIENGAESFALGTGFYRTGTSVSGILGYTEKRVQPTITFSHPTCMQLWATEGTVNDSIAAAVYIVSKKSAELSLTTADVAGYPSTGVNLKYGHYIDINAEL